MEEPRLLRPFTFYFTFIILSVLTTCESVDLGDKNGQDGNYTGYQSAYEDNGDGTITDLVTGLMWQKDMGEKKSFDSAKATTSNFNLSGYNDWRIPTIKELYSLIQFTGMNGGSPESSFLFINDAYFLQPWGDTEAEERYIDAQTWSSSQYVGTTMNNNETVFGVNFVDGRIKGYPLNKPGSSIPNKMYFRLVRGNSSYGINDYVDNDDGTVSDLATGLMWQQADDGIARNWEEALAYAGQYPYYWTGTTHLDGPDPENAAVYIAF